MSGSLISTVAVTVSVLGLLIAYFTTQRTYRAQQQAWRLLARERRLQADAYRTLAAAVKGPDAVQKPQDPDYDLLDEYWGKEGSPTRNNLLLPLAQIEQEAGLLLDQLVEPRTRQLFEIRSELRRLNVWKDEDIELFDKAMAQRNSVVHGSAAPTWAGGSIDVRQLDRLLDRVHAHLPQ